MDASKDLKDLEMHQSLSVDGWTMVVRVPGGLLYQTQVRIGAVGVSVHTTFVPLFIGQCPASNDPLWNRTAQ